MSVNLPISAATIADLRYAFTASPSRRIAQLEEDIRELRRAVQADTEASGAPEAVNAKGEQESLSSAAQLATELGLLMPSRNLGGIEISPGDHFDLIDR